jgi:hypothetical protein
MRVGCVEHAGDEGLRLGCRDGSSDLEVWGRIKEDGTTRRQQAGWPAAETGV